MEANLDIIWNLIETNIGAKRDKTPGFVPDVVWLKERIKDHIEYMSKFDDSYKGVTEKELNRITKEALTRINTKQPLHLFLGKKKQNDNWVEDFIENGQTKWNSWNEYKNKILVPNISINSIDELDNFGNYTISHTGNPNNEESFLTRGLVFGDIQSGKTTGYCTLITKAFDLGYKNFIILSGMSEDLRCQTQERIEEAFTGANTRYFEDPGFESAESADDRNQKLWEYNKNNNKLQHRIPYDVTQYTQAKSKRDFTKRNINQPRPSRKSDTRPTLIVAKKSRPILDNVYRWLTKYAKNTYSENFQMVSDAPTLIIDDEADLASINTNKPLNKEYWKMSMSMREEEEKDSNDFNPSAINRLVRQIMNIFDQVSFIGFTGTPFANIFQDVEEHEPLRETPYNKDLFPEDFIVDLKSSDVYFGSKRLFNIDTDPNTGQSYLSNPDKQLPIVEKTFDNDLEDWLPLSHEKDDPLGKNIPASLSEAIKVFIISTAIKEWRRIENHSTMMIHCSRYKKKHQEIVEQVTEFVEDLRRRVEFDDPDTIQDLKNIFESVHVKTNAKFQSNDFSHNNDIYKSFPKWEEVKKHLTGVLERLGKRHGKSFENGVIVLNSETDDTLDFKEPEYNKPGKYLYKIIVGGARLSRGLTIEGLTVSYFTRMAKVPLYDTLMQMGRWYGYRDNYLDLIRLYIPAEHLELLQTIGIATEEVRTQLQKMIDEDKTPKDFAIYVKNHPIAKITNPTKSRYVEKVTIEFGGGWKQCLTYSGKTEDLQNDIGQFENLYKKLNDLSSSNNEEMYKHQDSRNHLDIWHKVPKEIIVEHLSNLSKLSAPGFANAEGYSEYIKNQSQGHLKEWTVVFNPKKIGTDDEKYEFINLNKTINLRTRSGIWNEGNQIIRIKATSSGGDSKLDFTEQEENQLKITSKNASNKHIEEEISKIRPHSRGLLVIYPLNLPDKLNLPDNNLPLLAWCIGLPKSGREPVEVSVNTTVLEHQKRLEGF